MSIALPALYALCLAVVTVYGLNLGWLAWKAAGAAPRDPALSRSDPAEPPRVTVQLPLYNEAAVAARLIDAVARLDYPRNRLDVQVLDDSTDETTGIVAERVRHHERRGLQVLHLHRRERSGFKAGALAAGLRGAQGELIAVFDADFVPAPDFLRTTVPEFRDPLLGCLQVRWSYLNAEVSLLTRLQALGLDAHFAVEQAGRDGGGYALSFNGTAGIWRRACIEDAGGWSADTLTEDLDLSYRAQLRGWKFRFRVRQAVPSELPVDMGALRSQQRRWTVGAVQCARKLVPRVLRAEKGPVPRGQALLHLTAPVVYPAVLLLCLLNAPVSTMRELGPAYFAPLSLGVFGLAGYVAAHLSAQRMLHVDWAGRLLRLPWLLAASMGLSLTNSVALFRGLTTSGGEFVRTPKVAATGADAPPRRRSPLPWIVLGEGAVALALTAGVFTIAAERAWGALPFQVLAASGFWLLLGASILHASRFRRAGATKSRAEYLT